MITNKLSIIGGKKKTIQKHKIKVKLKKLF